MIRKFVPFSAMQIAATALFLTTIFCAASKLCAQTSSSSAPDAPPSQPQSQPAQSSSQETADEDSIGRRKAKPKDYKNWTFNLGGGASTLSGTTKTFVRNGGPLGAFGVARNGSKYLGLRADFQWDNLPLRDSALGAGEAQASNATSHVYTLMVDPIINIPVTKLWGGYVVIGPSFLHRSGKLDSSTAVPGSGCSAFFAWWGTCFNGSLPLSGKFLSESQNEFGVNFGAGITRKVYGNVEAYAEFRFVHGSHNNITTDFRPISIGVRW